MTFSAPDIEIATLAIAAVLLCHAALHDVIARTIPDADCALLALLGLLDRLLHRQLMVSCVSALTVLAACHLLWSRGWLGGGDVKLIAACCGLVAPVRIPGLIGAIMCIGGLLAVGYLSAGARARARSRPQTPSRNLPIGVFQRFMRRENWRLRRGAGLPYGVAVSAAALLTLWRH